MKRRLLAIVAFVFCLGFSLQPQQDPAKITLVPVAGPVFMLQGGGGNIGIVADAAGVPDRLAPWTEGFLTATDWLELVYRSLEKAAGR